MRRARVFPTIATAALVLAACESEPIIVGRGVGPPAPGDPAALGSDPAASGSDSAAAAEGGDPSATHGEGTDPLAYRDGDFVEGDTNRDPFRSFAALFVPRQSRSEAVQREVIMSRTAIEDMRLIAIVSGIANPSAMLVDGDGTGYTVHRGDYIGRPEIVQTGGEDAVPITLNWRVDRIRPGEVVLSREDPTAPNRPPLTRVLPLHEDEAAGLTPGR